jgi:two-component system, sensor histidine kinase and response regulator
MPDMDGFALAEEIKRRKRLARAAIMMLTSGARPGDRARCFEVGVSSYLMKPIKQSDLLDTIMEVLAAPQARRAARAAAETAVPKAGRPLRILVAEDNPVNQQVALGLLERAGHSVRLAHNGREALGLLDEGAFDLVLMDVQMPEMDGLEATAAIRQRERATGQHIPIVAVTAHSMKGDADRCLAAGMDAYVAKPLRVQQLFDAIAGLAGGALRPRVVAPAPEAARGDEAAASSSVVPTAGPLDEALLLERVGGDRRALAKLAALFLADSPKLLGRIRRAVLRRDARELQGAAHALKGAVSNFAAPAATEAAFRLQKMGEAGDLGEAEPACARLEEELQRVRAALGGLLSKEPRGRTARARRRPGPQAPRRRKGRR